VNTTPLYLWDYLGVNKDILEKWAVSTLFEKYKRNITLFCYYGGGR
jgi:hypothetical protein